MAIHRFCKQCRGVFTDKFLGTNGICITCMENAIHNSPKVAEPAEPAEPVKPAEEKPAEPAVEKTPRKPAKSVILIKDDQEMEFNSMTAAAKFLKTNATQVKRNIESGKPLNGWSIA